MATSPLAKEAKDAGADKALVAAVKDATNITHNEAVDRINDYVGIGFEPPLIAEKVIAYIKPISGGLVAQAEEAMKDSAPAGFQFGDYLKTMKEDHEENLLKPGRYEITISDTRVGANANDRGLFYGVLECTVDDQPDADPILMFAAVNVGELLKNPNGNLDLEKLGSDPIAKKQFLGGLATVEKLIQLSSVEMSEIAGATDADDMLANFVGQRYLAIVGSGTDQYGLKTNTIKKLVKGLNDD
jgi:hypothetical protein